MDSGKSRDATQQRDIATCDTCTCNGFSRYLDSSDRHIALHVEIQELESSSSMPTITFLAHATRLQIIKLQEDDMGTFRTDHPADLPSGGVKGPCETAIAHAVS
jgi:hypothetical protein